MGSYSLVSVLKATCPFVTAVGATQINPGSTVNDPEGACEQVILSGGGFSNIFPFVSSCFCNVSELIHLKQLGFLPGPRC